MLYIPVVDSAGAPLMPCHPARARELVRNGKAVRRFVKCLFYIQLTERVGGAKQDIAIGIDPGSKREALTVKSEAHTFLNIQAEAVQHVSKAVEARRNMRRARRFRKTPCRKNRNNRARGGLVPSTKARWQWKLRIVAQLAKIYPITDIVVEDIKAVTKRGKRKWNCSFSPLEIGKKWFYEELKRFGKVHTKQGYETFEMRNAAGLKKSSRKLSEVFEAHCVDSWVLANWLVGGHVIPDNKRMMCIAPIRLHRRQLHMLQPAKNGVRKRYGGTRSCGLKRGSLVYNSKCGLSYVGGTTTEKISLHSVVTGRRVTQVANPADCRFLTYNMWRARLLPDPKAGVSVAKN